MDPSVLTTASCRADKTGTVEDVLRAGIVVPVVVFEGEDAWRASRESANDLAAGVVAGRGACIQGKGL